MLTSICSATWLTRVYIAPNLPSFLLPDPWPDGQAIQHYPRVPAYSNFRPPLFLNKVADQAGRVPLTPVFQAHVERGSSVTRVHF